MKKGIKILSLKLLVISLMAIIGLGGFVSVSVKATSSDWLSPNWNYRKAIIIDNSSNSDSLTDFQVLVTLDSNFEYSKANPDGRDIRFTDSNGLTEISYWIKEWNNADGESKIWVKVPSIPALSTTTIYLYYGNSGTTSPTSNFDTTMQKLEVDSSTVALWHFDDATGTTLTDSSVNANNGTMYNFALDNSDWVADSAFSSGGALNFDGIDDYIEVPHNNSLNLGAGDFTVEFWGKVSEESPEYQGVVIDKFDLPIPTGSFPPGFLIWSESASIPNSSDIGVKFSFITRGGILSIGDEVSADEVPFGNWYYITAVRINGITRCYRDGNLIESGGEYKIVGNIDNTGALTIGTGIVDVVRYYKGLIDEIRISTRALSDEEIKADYERRKYTAIEPTFSLGTEEATPYDVSATITVGSGGTVTNTAGTVAIDIPAGALATTTDITVEASEVPGSFQVQGAEPIDYVYTFGPEGTTFSQPVTLIFTYNDTGMTLEEEQGLDIYLYDETAGIWVDQGAVVDTGLNTLTITVTHFSSFVVGGNIALKEISKLLSLVDEFYEQGEIENQGIAQSLNIQLRNAQRKIREGETAVAIEMLENFASRVEKLSPKLIEPEAAEIMIGKAQGIITVLQ